MCIRDRLLIYPVLFTLVMAVLAIRVYRQAAEEMVDAL